MEYYTDYKVSVDDPEISKVLDTLLEEVSRYSFNGGIAESIKWYGWEKDMRKLSRQYPLAIFEVVGVGEEEDDIWKAYIMGGLIQKEKAQIAFAPFDTSKLV